VDSPRSPDQVFDCHRCGQRVTFVGGWAPPDHPELASGVCSTCRMRERANGLSADDVAAIRTAARIGTLLAVKVARGRLGWSLNEAVSLVHVLRADAEPGAAPDRRGM
jgi:hypothetical protein